MSLGAWPALEGWTVGAAPAGLRTERAVWGKVQGIGAGFRWIARSAGFGSEAPDLERRLRAGREDRPLRACAWRALPERSLAVVIYPSRARDAAGRGGFLERQVLEWRPLPGIPPALAALVLLPAAAGLDDAIWWGRQSVGPWEDPAFALPIAPADCPALDLDPERIASALERGIAELTGRVGPERLRDLYADLLAGIRPALLAGLDAPLGPEALAALLLPLPSALAGRLSLLGGLPGTRLEPADLADNWDLAVGEGLRSDSPLATRHSSLDPAERLAAALLERDPGRLRAPAARPPRSAAALLAEIESFAADPGRRYLDLAQLRPLLRAAPQPLLLSGEPADHPLCRWIERTADARPAWADPGQWEFKIDQLRAAALYLLPHPETLARVGLPRDPHCPALLLALARDPRRAGPALAGHGDAALSAIVRHSLDCPRPMLQTRLRAWIERWRSAVGADSPLGCLIGDCLAAGRST